MHNLKPQMTGWLLCLFLVSCNFVTIFSAQRLVALRYSYDALCSFVFLYRVVCNKLGFKDLCQF